MSTDIALPDVTDVQRLDVRPGDRFVITLDAGLIGVSGADVRTIKERAAHVLGVEPDRILVMAGSSLSVLSSDAPES